VIGLCLPAGCWLSAVGVVVVVAGCVRVLVVLLAGALLRLGLTSRAGGASVLLPCWLVFLLCCAAVVGWFWCCRCFSGAAVLVLAGCRCRFGLDRKKDSKRKAKLFRK
jgi:hypothetical protein